jgi:hypothetical protein
MSRRAQIYVLAGLGIVLALVLIFGRNQAPTLAGTAGDEKYQPLNVPDPALRIDLLDQIHKQEYMGTHRNIFSAAPPPPPVPKPGDKDYVPPVAPPVNTGPPPVVVPATFFGYTVTLRTGKRQAFFTNGDDVFIVDEGATLLNRFRLLKIGNNTAELEEISSGRHTTVNMEEPPASGQ